MSIGGLYDMDMATYTLSPLILRMKALPIIRKKREVVILSPSFTPATSKIFYLRKDFDDGNNPFPVGLRKKFP